MANILLIEPEYHCKYPPLGLMKIAYYHKEIRKDFVWFSKGKLPDCVSGKIKEKLSKSKYYVDKYGSNLSDFIKNVDNTISQKKWDRVYVSTLFTYEWKITIDTIEYAKTLVEDKSNVFSGGILATLMGDEFEKTTGIKPVKGQLVNSILIGYDDGVNIDTLTPDYSILDNTEYTYPSNNAYFAYATRGCGMNCEFCAVKNLEPEYMSYISIKNQINEIRKKYGEKKDLLLMDNNVLKSKDFNKIIDEIIELGFEKGATYINPETGKKNNRYVDFNQGLDALLFDEEKVKLLSKIALRPARIAFDHIEDKERYMKALDLAVKYNITHLSNYLLYNSDDFVCKGKKYEADEPEDLYRRLRINVDYQEMINKSRKKEKRERIHIFSFPMRYIPLDAKERGYVSRKHWNMKYLRAIQRILIPTQGKGVSSKSFFEAAFGRSVDEYMMVLLMPEDYIATRGKPEKISNITEEDRLEKKEEFEIWEGLRKEWEKLYNSLTVEQKIKFKEIISKNEFTIEILKSINDKKIRKIFIHYFSAFGIITVLEDLEIQMEDELIEEIIYYITKECKLMIKRLAKYMVKFKLNSTQIKSFFRFFGQGAVNELVDIWVHGNYEDERVVELLEYTTSSYNYVYYFMLMKWCSKLNLVSESEFNRLVVALKQHNKTILNEILADKYEKIFEVLTKKYGSIMDEKQLNSILLEVKNELTHQMSLFN
jgi:hypothetical protein